MRDYLLAVVTLLVTGALAIGFLIAFAMGDSYALVWVLVWGGAFLAQLPWVYAYMGQVMAREREYHEAIDDRLTKYV